MSQEKEQQIEELAHIVSNAIKKWVNEAPSLSNPHFVATAIYCAGYRKQIEGEWISVEERLPETEGWYFVWDDVQETVKKRFFYKIPPNFPVETYPHIREYFGNVSDYKRFTHWMPLPEPPRKEQP